VSLFLASTDEATPRNERDIEGREGIEEKIGTDNEVRMRILLPVGWE